MSSKETILEVFNEIYSKENDGKILSNINEEDILLELGIDSLSFAMIVVELETRLGYDPFMTSEEPFYPRTFGEFVEFYDKNKS